MSTRFRVRFLGGGEATVESLEAFCDLVQSGEITADDLVHDALTGDWVPAVAHPMYKLALDPLVASEEARAAKKDGTPEQGAADDDFVVERGGAVHQGDEEATEPPDTLFTLAAPTPEPNPERAAADFIRQMEDERAADPEPAWLTADVPTMGGVIDMGVEPVSGGSWQPEAYEATPYRPSPSYPPPRQAPPRRRRTLPLSLTLILILGSAGVAGGVGLSAWPGLEAFGVGESAPPEVVPVRLTATEEQLSAAAYEVFLGKIAGLARSRGVGAVPRDWLEGRYLAEAAAFPAVGSYWARYRDYVDEAQAREEDLYRAAYLEHLQRLGVRSSQGSSRVAGAMSEFNRHRASRRSAYTRATALADAALELHELSVAAAGRISYEPARSNRVSADPVIEAAGRDAEMQEDLDQALDRVLVALHGDAESGPGPGRAGLAGWLVELLRAPATVR
jgi:hypothetical protein